MANSSRNYCTLTSEMRESLRTHREELGLSLKQLGEVLHIDWSTIRNWENGRTERCHPRNFRRINGFLAGEYDAMAFAADGDAACQENGPQQQKSPMLAYCAERISNTCRLCADHEEIRNKLISDINASMAKAMRLMLE